MTEVEQLIAAGHIRTLFHRRLRYMDTRQWHRYAALHTEDAVTETYGADARIEGAEAIAAAIQAFMEDPLPIQSVHQAFEPDITFQSDTEASGIWPMEDRLWWQNGDSEEWLHGWGHYHENYRRVDGRWLIAYRRLTRLRVDMSPGFVDRRV